MLNAAHAVLPFDTKVQITLPGDDILYVPVRVNEYVQPNNSILLELSEAAAKKLGMEKEGTIPCIIKLYEPEYSYSTIKTIAKFTGSFFVVVLLVMAFL